MIEKWETKDCVFTYKITENVVTDSDIEKPQQFILTILVVEVKQHTSLLPLQPQRFQVLLKVKMKVKTLILNNFN